MSDLSQAEASAVFSAILPEFRPNSNGKHRGPATYRNGDNPSALSVDTANGGRYYDHVIGEGGDCIDFIKTALAIDFRGACRAIADITGRDLYKPLEKLKRRHSTDTLTKAARFRIGILWRIDRNLAILKAELFGPHHKKASIGVKGLTQWRAEIKSWNTYKAAEVMRQLFKNCPVIVNAAIEEAAISERALAQAIADAFPPISKDAEAA